MTITCDSLSSVTRTFISVVERCLAETTSAEDRHLYAGDLAAANAWLTRLAAGEPPTAIAAEILDPATAKQFTDYWRRGVWGDLESTALDALQKSIRRELPP